MEAVADIAIDAATGVVYGLDTSAGVLLAQQPDGTVLPLGPLGLPPPTALTSRPAPFRLYALLGSNQVVEIDPAIPVALPPVEILGEPGLIALEWHETDQVLYGISQSLHALVQVDLVAATAVSVAPIEAALDLVALAAPPEALRVVGLDASGRRLMEIEVASGAAMELLPLALDEYRGLAVAAGFFTTIRRPAILGGPPASLLSVADPGTVFP